ncbi:LuxR C-terminal-related transcriptional regulator [Paenibacillus tuaregi]|uniref:LuxR C-terminal-related transcriptional regulator n=1 Tax=Paenibacillus tuaregi TaxID=1816681 RepID=UPI000838A1C7|nr:LuxR C-terminal-related transcriptional regulator [Paenibacillus tuaregi]
MNLSDYSVILKAKIAVPAPKEKLITRSRLTEALDQGTLGRLTVISAPAGFGKSTLLSQRVHSREQACAWLSLDELDNDPVRFWRYVAHAMCAVVGEESAGRIRQLASSFPSMSALTFLDALNNELYELPRPVDLICDDYQCISNPEIHEQTAYFLEYLPDHLHMVISTRAELPFSTMKWVAKQESTQIRTLDIQFTNEETQMYYSELAGLELTADQARQLSGHIEGWATGLQLMSLSLRSDRNFSKLIEEFKGSRHDVAEYLFHEVLSKLPADIRHFLLSTSVLGRLDPLLCEHVTGDPGSPEKLETLKDLNLFVIPLDSEHHEFRYHHLFAQFLQGQLKRNEREEWLRLHVRAAHYLAGRGAMEEAIEHAIAAEDYALTEEYLSRHIPAALERGELGTLLYWFGNIPADYDLSLEMSLFHTFVLVMTKQLETAECQLERIQTSLGGVQDAARREQLQSGILFVRSNLVFMNRDFAKWFAFIGGILDNIIPENPTYYNINYNLTEPLVRRTPMGLNGVLSEDTEKIGTMFTGALEAHGWQDSLINLYVKQSLCEGYYEWNKLAECRSLMPAIERAATSKNIWGLIVPLVIMEAKLYMSEGRFHMAHHTLDEAAAKAEASGQDMLWTKLLASFRARIYLRENRVQEARKEAAKLGISGKDKPTYNQEYHYVTLARLLGSQHKESEALRLLELLKPQAAREQQLASLVEITVLQALIQHQWGQRTMAITLLHEALIIGEQNGYKRSFADEGPEMGPLLGVYSRWREDGMNKEQAQGVSDAYVQSLLELFPKADKPFASRQTKSQTESLNPSEQKILKLLQQGAANKQIAAELGLTEGTVRVYLSRMYEKLHVSTRTQAIIAAQELTLSGE